jgi:hypothetical protein
VREILSILRSEHVFERAQGQMIDRVRNDGSPDRFFIPANASHRKWAMSLEVGSWTLGFIEVFPGICPTLLSRQSFLPHEFGQLYIRCVLEQLAFYRDQR